MSFLCLSGGVHVLAHLSSCLFTTLFTEMISGMYLADRRWVYVLLHHIGSVSERHGETCQR